MIIDLRQDQLQKLINCLRALAARYESEAAAFAAMGIDTRDIALGRLKDAKEVWELWEYLTGK